MKTLKQLKTLAAMSLRFVTVAPVAAGLASIAAAQAAKVDLTGKWIFNVTTDAGSGTPTITLKQEGEKLTGQYHGQPGDVDDTGPV